MRNVFFTRTVIGTLIIGGIALFYDPAYQYIKARPEIYISIHLLSAIIFRRLTECPANFTAPAKAPLKMFIPFAFLWLSSRMALPEMAELPSRLSRLLLFGLFGVVLTTGCATVEPPLNPKVYYKHDMYITVNGKSRIGTMVAPQAKSYDIKITSNEDMDQLQISTCARDDDANHPIVQPRGIFKWLQKKRSFEFTFVPNTSEREPGCTLKLAGLNQKYGKHSWAFIEFENPKFSLPAGISCNTVDYGSKGTTVCQTLQNLETRIWFDQKVALSGKVLERCKIPASKDGLVFKFNTRNRDCIYEFMELKKPYRRHRLTTIGYEDVPIRVE